VPRPLALLALIAIASFCPPSKAAEPEKPAPSPTDKPAPARRERYRVSSPDEEKQFKALVASGDRALEAGRLNDSVVAYADALDIKFDARLSGRLGLVITMFLPSPKLDMKAAHFLSRAVEDAAGISTTERRQFFDAYERVRKRVCKLEVAVNYVDVMVSIDHHDPIISDGSFWTFIAPGTNDVIASLSGREDIKQAIDCIPGKGMFVEFEFPPLLGEEPKTVVVKAAPERIIIREEFARDELRAPEPAIKPEPPRSRLVGGLGPVMVIGAAPSASLGVSIAGQYRREGWFAMATAKGAWSLGDVEKRPIDIFSASATVGPCVQLQGLDACVFGGATLFDQRMEPNALYRLRTNTSIIPSLGLGVGATYPIKEGLSARVFVDATALTHDVIVGIVSQEGATIPLWQTQRFLFSISASLMFGR